MIIIKNIIKQNDGSMLYLVKYHKWFYAAPIFLKLGDVLRCNSSNSLHKILSIKSFPSQLKINSYELKVKKFIYLQLDGDLLTNNNLCSIAVHNIKKRHFCPFLFFYSKLFK